MGVTPRTADRGPPSPAPDEWVALRAEVYRLRADGTIARELNRSFSHATDYDYPVALGRLPDDLRSGTRLTTDGRRDPADVFHSRLAVSPDGRHLLMAGWVWTRSASLRCSTWRRR